MVQDPDDQPAKVGFARFLAGAEFRTALILMMIVVESFSGGQKSDPADIVSVGILESLIAEHMAIGVN